jgi:hypothetical protein
MHYADRPADRPADPTWGDRVLTNSSSPAERSAADDLWAACVQGQHTLPHGGGDASMRRCDDLYQTVTGQSPESVDLYLWCPGPATNGGCYAMRGDL